MILKTMVLFIFLVIDFSFFFYKNLCGLRIVKIIYYVFGKAGLVRRKLAAPECPTGNTEFVGTLTNEASRFVPQGQPS